jgi:hypothetical protein
MMGAPDGTLPVLRRFNPYPAYKDSGVVDEGPGSWASGRPTSDNASSIREVVA